MDVGGAPLEHVRAQGGDGHEDDLVLIVAEGGVALGLEEAEDAVRVPADAEHAADGVERAVELARGGRADDADLLVDGLGLGAPRLALLDLEVAHGEVAEARADDAGLRVLPLVDGLRAGAHEGRAGEDAGRLAREGVAVELGEPRAGRVVLGAGGVRRLLEDVERVGAQARHGVGDRGARPLAQRDHGHHRGDADGDADDREPGAQLVAPDHAQRDEEGGPEAQQHVSRFAAR